MELKEAFDIIDATLGMFRSIEEEVENGDLKEEFTGDGIHLKAASCERWHRFLRKNAIVIPGSAETASSEQ